MRARGSWILSLVLALSGAAAWLGGHLVYDHEVGVDHSPSFDGDADWQPVLAEADLPERDPTRAEYDGEPVLLYRDGGALYALAATCAHAGGPLDEGEVVSCEDGRCAVRCPWHDSVFDLRDGSIVHGPTVHRQPAFEVRLHEGQIELRPRST
jgi:nitrite reductase/ring-hydroxylating ferredoxin subunit